ncbi:MAG: hypothetical protein C4305_03555, partial [Thermoleophilia bacterium]
MDKSSPPPYCFTWLAASLVTALAAALAQVGGDARWLAALGAEIVKRGHIPDGVPYAALPSSGWPNVPVLSELAFDGLESALGDRGLVLAQATAAGACLALVALGMRAAG